MGTGPNRQRSPAESFDALTASADLAGCELDRSAAVPHHWLREHQPHDAVAITANGTGELVSRWTSPAFTLSSGIDLSAADTARTLGRPIVAAAGEAPASSVTILVVLERRQELVRFGLDRVLLALARVIAARVGRSPTGADTASLSLAHAVAAQRERLPHELTQDFTGQLQTILDQLRGAAPRRRISPQTST
jgi:hypothetical protein